jgi:hypothetical protein
MKDLVGGQTYIECSVAMNGSMWLETFVVCGQPKKGPIGWQIRTSQYRSWKNPFFTDVFAADAGLDPDRRYNHHRTFKFNTKNKAMLDDLVKRQDLVAYLTLIGVENPAKTIERDQERWAFHQELDRELDSMMDDGPYDWDDFDSSMGEDEFEDRHAFH